MVNDPVVTEGTGWACAEVRAVAAAARRKEALSSFMGEDVVDAGCRDATPMVSFVGITAYFRYKWAADNFRRGWNG